MSNRKIKREVLFVFCAATLIALCAFASFIPSSKTYAQTSETSVANLTEEQYGITNTNAPNGIELKSYATKNYGKNATLSWKLNKKSTVLGDDDIIKIVPEQLFKQVGIVQHIGREYGFFIETRKPFEDNEMLLSTVMIIDVINENDMFAETSKSHLKIKLSPIFQADFAYVEKGNDKIYSLQEQNYEFFKEDYKKDLEIEYPSDGNGFVLPIPTTYGFPEIHKIGYLQHNKYFLTNASNETSLYNVNYLNPYDDGYVPQNDAGCFFSQLDFNYDGFFMQKGKTNAKDVGTVVYNAASLAFDLYDKAKGLKSVFKAVPVLGQAVTFADTLATIVNIGEDLKYNEVSEAKNITYEPYYNNKEQQIANGGLRKDASMAIKSNNEKQLLFGTDDYFEFDYQIHCQDVNIDTRYATMINVGVMSVINTNAAITQFGQLHESTSIYSNELKNHTDTDYKEILKLEIDEINAEARLNILPNYTSMIQLAPTYSGNYEISVANLYSKFVICEVSKPADGGLMNYKDTANVICRSQKINGEASSGEVFLYKSRNYILIADLQDNVEVDHVLGRYEIVTLNITFVPTEVYKGTQVNQTIQSGETIVFEYDFLGADAFNYSINSDDDIELEISYGSLKNGYDWKSGVDLSGSVISKDRKEYLKIKNDTAAVLSVTVSVEEVDRLNTEEENSIILTDTKACSVSLPYTMNVTLLLSSDNPAHMEVYNQENEFIAGSLTASVKKASFTILSNQKYYVLIKRIFGTSLSASLRFEYNISDLKPVYNYFNQIDKDSVMHYKNENFTGSFLISTALDFKLYNAQSEAVNANDDGSYTLIKDTDYYFNILKSGSQCNIDFNVVYTTETSGVFPDSGAVYIKYIPAESGEYNVNGEGTYFWLDKNLNYRYGALTKDDTYFLLIEGQAGEAYTVTVSRAEIQKTQLPLLMGVERNAGAYYFVIEQQGDYSFKTFRNSDAASSNITIYDATGTEYCKNICTDFSLLKLTLQPGTYYLDLQIEPIRETVTIRISKNR